MKYSVVSIWLALLVLPQLGLSQANCDLRKDNDGIKVYLCESEISNFKTIVVDLEVPATLSQYAAVVLDIENYHQWQYKAINPRQVGKISKTELYYYSEVETPWPISNRDMIWHLRMSQDSLTKVLTVDLLETPDYLPEVEGVVRIPKAHSTLTVTPIDKTNVQVHYSLDVEPGGEVPAWISNMFAAQAPWQTYNTFRKRIIAQGENRVTVSFIEDF